MDEKGRKKIAFVLNHMVVGGVEQALIDLLNNINREKYDIRLFTQKSGNPYLNQIPSGVTVHYIDEIIPKEILAGDIKRGRLFKAARGIFYRFLSGQFIDNYFKNLKYSAKAYILSEELFDLAMAFKFGYCDGACVTYQIHAKKKAAWVHGIFPLEPKSYLKWAKNFDRIFCVSLYLKSLAEESIPSAKGKTDVIYNLIDVGKIIEKSNEPVSLPSLSGTSILTVGRLSPEKNQSVIPAALRLLLDAGYDARWYLIGDGRLRGAVESECRKYDVSDRVVLLGTQSNPYPYMKACDIYVQPSLTEGWCLTVEEARILRKPIVVTPLPVMREQIVDGENGIIADGTTSEALFRGVRTILDHPEKREKFAAALGRESHDNTAGLQKLYDFIES